MQRSILTLCALVLLGACQTNSNAGSGPITLAPSVENHLRKYMKEQMPVAFAVSIDGWKSSYRFCPDSADYCWGEASQWKAIQACQKISRGVPCKIYAVGHDIKWETEPSN